MLGVLFSFVLIAFVVTMFDAQIVHGAEYLAKSVRANTKVEVVKTSRGSLTDRNGKVLVSSQSVYTLELDPSLAASENDILNADLTRLLALFERLDLDWEDDLPVTADSNFVYAFDAGQKRDLYAYLASKKWVDNELTTDDPPPMSVAELFSLLREEYGVDPTLTNREARSLVALRYTLAVTKLNQLPSYTLLSDIPTSLIAQIKDGDYAPVFIGTASARTYHTDYAAHILGRIGKIQNWDDYRDKGYAMDALVGISGVESAFEEYLHGSDGRRVITTNDAGKITSEVYSVPPEPGNTVALTIDIDFQAAVEEILAATSERMSAEDGVARPAAAAVVEIGTSDVLALASYPTFSLTTFNEDYQKNYEDPLKPFLNRATMGTYAPGSTFKPLTAIAALETGIIEPNTHIMTRGRYIYYNWPYNCWLFSSTGGTHGNIDVSQAITDSCNYFFYDVGRMTGISTLARYAAAFGLGEPTGIEIPEYLGVMTTPDYVNSLKGHYWTDGQTLTAAIGQSYSLFTPLQLANYIATLCDGGTRHNAHLLKTVKTHDSAALVDVYDEPPAEIISLEEENLSAVLEGMHDLTTEGSVSWYFRNCIVDAGAKTGTAQTGREHENGVFVAFAPYDDPEIALAIVIEKGGSGGALAQTAVDILNAYFSSVEDNAAIRGEQTLLP